MNKICPKCKNELSYDNYNFDKNGKINTVCKSCKNENYKNWYKNNKNKVKERKCKYHTQTKEYRRWYTIKLRYGITKEEYENMLLKQKGGCAICGKTKSGHKNTDEMVVDHCHKTKIVRGLLCNRCNTLLGLIDDNPSFMENIANYLNK